MTFEHELDAVLPADLPHREKTVESAAKHLSMIVEVNKTMNLTRILNPREAAIKHVLDSVIPWRLFAGASHVVDAGTGAGFPGIPLALVLPETRFTLAESIQKKARFTAEAAAALGLKNVEVKPERAESLAAPALLTARAMAPVPKFVDLFRKALRNGTKLLLYKGPDVEQDSRAHVEVVLRYSLPDDLGSRTVLAVSAR